jgi:acyl-CoA thioester hydrolase
MRDKMLTSRVTPRFGDTDGLKHINNIVLAEWFELARNDLYRFFTPDLDLCYEKWKLIMVHTEFDFLYEMSYGYDVDIKTYIIKIGNTSFTTYHEAWQKGQLKSTGEAVIVHYDFIEKKSKPIPPKVREMLEEHRIDKKDLKSASKG